VKLTAWPAVKTGAITGFARAKSGLTWFFGKIKSGLSWYGKQTGQSKLLIVAVIILAAGAAAMTRIVIHGSFLPTLEQDFVYSFANGADHAYTFAADEKWQDLNDPLLHPEHIVLLERLVVNLRAPGDGSNPMALLDLYVEVGTQEGAVEIKNRDAEVRDMVLRTMEQISYDEIVTETGKNKLKVFLRKNLNDMLSSGRVRRLYFKSIVLKP
jgi:flagellar basal body-associated protein FliL